MDELAGAVLRWIETSVGDGARVVSVRAMEPASAEMHEVDDRVVGVVDWPTTAWGPPGIDLARMRLNLVEEVSPASADAFLVAYRAAGGDPDDRHPYWDLCATPPTA